MTHILPRITFWHGSVRHRRFAVLAYVISGGVLFSYLGLYWAHWVEPCVPAPSVWTPITVAITSAIFGAELWEGTTRAQVLLTASVVGATVTVTMVEARPEDAAMWGTFTLALGIAAVLLQIGVSAHRSKLVR